MMKFTMVFIYGEKKDYCNNFTAKVTAAKIITVIIFALLE